MNNIYMIVATDKNNAIGYKNDLLCHIPEDLKYFKDITKGNTIVVGSNTYLSFPKRPLPDRFNIILSTSLVEKGDNIIVYKNIDSILDYAKSHENEKIFICGGESIYRQFLDYASKLYITKIDKEFMADTYFPNLDEKAWSLESSKKGENCEKVGFEYRFEVYNRI